jgi:hypothetical protein
LPEERIKIIYLFYIIKMDRIESIYGSIFIEINKQINYIINDNEILCSNNYFKCIDEIIIVLRNTLYKLQDIYYKYILYPKLKKI